MTSAFFDRAIPKSDTRERTEEQTSWRDKDARLDRRALARERALKQARAKAERDRLDEIEARRAQARASLTSQHILVGKEVPQLLAALRAVLELHKEAQPSSNPDQTPVCSNCDWDYPCPTVTSIAAALGETL